MVGYILCELTFKDNFMFAAVMMDEENAKGVLERALDMEIERIEISYEKSIVYNPEYKGIRLDVYIKDDNNTHFNVEMQVANKKILKRARYYHSQIDMDLLETGIDYEEIPNSYVIFICDFDPIGLGKYKYTRYQRLLEDDTYEYEDGSHTVFLSTVGQNEDEVSKDLVNFLKYAGLDASNENLDCSDAFVQKLQTSATKSNLIGKWGKGSHDLGPVPQNLKRKIESIESFEQLEVLVKKAARAESLEEFEQALDETNKQSCQIDVNTTILSCSRGICTTTLALYR